jgi:predicted glycoside hydrolase/deacetylase ChbG (UPF0249 family)
MLIINADDFGMTRIATDRILDCCQHSRVTSVSAMVFMEDSERAAQLALENNIDVGLHVNFTQPFTASNTNPGLCNSLERIKKHLLKSIYHSLLFNPFLMKDFHTVYGAQLDEFKRLYKRFPSHYDGHHHMHLCMNMLVQKLVPENEKVRRNFTFSRGEKSIINRTYRAIIDYWIIRRHQTTNKLFSLSQLMMSNNLPHLFASAKNNDIELQVHPAIASEYDFLMEDDFYTGLSKVTAIPYSQFISKANNNLPR